MKYLLDVNALVAFAFSDHTFHERVARWVSERVSPEHDELATCSIAELGFLRILAQVPQYGMTVADAKQLLRRMKREGAHKFSFLPDDQDTSRLPGWVHRPNQLTDGHLVRLAQANDAVLATLDRGIPDAFLIPGS
jgi:predicted nucleic acid-binding protein